MKSFRFDDVGVLNYDRDTREDRTSVAELRELSADRYVVAGNCGSDAIWDPVLRMKCGLI